MATIDATVDTGVWPYAVDLAITGLTVTDVVVVWRTVGGGERVTVRQGEFVADDTSADLTDYEQPYGVEITYGLTIDDVDDDTDTVTVTLTLSPIVLSDAITGLAAAVELVNLPKFRDRGATVFRPGGRNVVVSRPRGQWQDDLVLETATDEQAEDLEALLDAATLGIVQLRQNGTLADIDDYLAVLTDRKVRFSGNPDSEWRGWSFRVAQTDRWPLSVVPEEEEE